MLVILKKNEPLLKGIDSATGFIFILQRTSLVQARQNGVVWIGVGGRGAHGEGN